MTPKPMSKERREEIVRSFDRWLACESDISTDYVAELLGDAAFWREAVKNCVYSYDVDATAGDNAACCFCSKPAKSFVIIHDQDCPWLLAQE